ncbi:MAG: DnaJ domain-containing protein [Bacteroidota bacterium]|nr:DnaJ domain-containing protein [Bacteroidota bacterium]
MGRNFYQVLQVPQDATQKDIKHAFRRLAKKYHPDKNAGNPHHEEEFKKLNEAYHTLSDENKKWVYDMSLFVQQNPSVSTSTPGYSSTYRRYSRPRPYQSYNPPPPTTFSLKSYIQAAFFIAFLVFLVILCITLLNRYSSYYYYQEAVKDYSKGRYQSALSNLDFSIRDFGNKSPEASTLAAKILIYNLQNYQDALSYLDKSISNSNKEVRLAEIHYLKGLSLKNLGSFGEAYENYNRSVYYDQNFDSSYYEMGEINTFIFQDYQQALVNFNQLLKINSLFSDAYLGKGICYQKLNEHGLAVMNFEKFISLNSAEGTAYYLKSLSEIELNNKNLACQDLVMASELGIDEAKALNKSYCREAEIN